MKNTGRGFVEILAGLLLMNFYSMAVWCITKEWHSSSEIMSLLDFNSLSIEGRIMVQVIYGSGIMFIVLGVLRISGLLNIFNKFLQIIKEIDEESKESE